MTQFKVLPSDGGWEVWRSGAKKSSHRKKSTAVEKAKRKARGASPASVEIRRSDGTVQNVVNYGMG